MCFDSPIARCEVIGEMVLTDETQEECAREHHCVAASDCPLRRYFVESRQIMTPCMPKTGKRAGRRASA